MPWGLARCGRHPFSNVCSARHGNATSLPPCRFCASGSDSLEHALLYCTAHHMLVNAGCAVAHARYQCSSCLTQTRTLTLLVALPATSRMLHTKYEHFLRASASCSCTYLLKRVALLLVCFICFVMLIHGCFRTRLSEGCALRRRCSNFIETALTLQRALDAAHAWAKLWRFFFGISPTKFAVMVFANISGLLHLPLFLFAGHVLPRVRT